MKQDFTAPIAKTGEEQFACILRNRSGMDAGEIDYGYRSPDHLCDAEREDLSTTALLLYEAILRDSGFCGSKAVIQRIAEKWEELW